jgi:hypothetical protein
MFLLLSRAQTNPGLSSLQECVCTGVGVAGRGLHGADPGERFVRMSERLCQILQPSSLEHISYHAGANEDPDVLFRLLNGISVVPDDHLAPFAGHALSTLTM